MPVTRETRDSAVYQYATGFGLIPHANHFSLTSPALGQVAQWPTTVREWAFVPTFQRLVVWDRVDIEGLIETSSEMIGTTIWGKFDVLQAPFPIAVAPGTPGSALNYPPTNVLFLADGLQRFSIVTSVLAALDQQGVFSAGPLAPNFPRAAAGLSGNDVATFRFNHHVLANYPRPALAEKYIELFADVKDMVDGSSTSPQWCSALETFLLDRQIGVDVYNGFVTPAALAINFVGINTGTQQLGPIDVFRAVLVEDGLRTGWTSQDALDFDTELSQTLVLDPAASRLSPLSNQMGKLTDRNVPLRPLPTLRATNGAQLLTDARELLGRLKPYCDPVSGYDPYAVPPIREAYGCGKLPLSILIALYLDPGLSPWFAATPAGSPPDADLLLLLRGLYRVYIAGVEGRQTPLLLELLDGRLPAQGISDLAEKLSHAATESSAAVVGIDQQLDPDWLMLRLDAVGKNRAPRIFAACELPEAFSSTGALITPRPTSFDPLSFGTRNADLQIDHLIPRAAAGQLTAAEESLRNFAPIPGALNRAIGTLPCSAKLTAIGGAAPRYGDLVAGTYIPNRRGAVAVRPHPYVAWLVNTHAAGVSPTTSLDDRNELPGSVGDQRRQWLRDRLHMRV